MENFAEICRFFVEGIFGPGHNIQFVYMICNGFFIIMVFTAYYISFRTKNRILFILHIFLVSVSLIFPVMSWLSMS